MKSSCSNKTYGEALIVALVVAGSFWSMSEGGVQFNGLGDYAAFLALIVGFYFALLLCHGIFFHMIGGGHRPAAWWEHVEHAKKLEEKKKVAKK